MPRMHTVTRSKPSKKERICEKCRKPIIVGGPYIWYRTRMTYGKAYVGTKHYRHIGCRPTAIELEKNPKRQAYMRAEEALGIAKSAVETDYDPAFAADRLRDALGEIETIVDDLDNALSGWSGTGLEQSERAQTFGKTKDALEEWVSTTEDLASKLEDLEEVQEPDEPTNIEPPKPNRDDFVTAEGAFDEIAYDDALDVYEAEKRDWDEDNRLYEEEKTEYDEFVAKMEEISGELEDLPELEL